MTLALLLTAVGGAWAQGADYDIIVGFASSYNRMGTHFQCTIMSLEPGTIKGTLNLSVDGESKGSFNVNDNMVDGFIDPALDAGDHTWSAVFSPEGGGSFNRNGNFTIDKLYTSIAYYGSTSINMGEGESTELDVYVAPDGTDGLSYSSSDASVASITKKENSDDTYIIQAKAAGTATITFSFAGNNNYEAAEEDKTITVTVLPAPIKVTTNDDKTEAWFNMPANDVTAEYELVRDMSVQMTATMGDGTDGVRYRVKKSEQNPGKYAPADMDMMQVLTLVAVNDGIEHKALTLDEDYFCRIYKLDEQTLKPEGDGVKLVDFDFAPGLYALKAFAKDGSNYDGETALSNTFKLFEGYELKIAAGEFATYYKDEALYVEDTDAQLYTITSVNGDKANVVQVDVAKANMPILVKNNSADEKTILLIPTSEQTPDEVSAAEEFVGTLTATQIAASDATTERYALNGKEFVWVKDAIAVGANRAWLEVPTSAAAEAHAIELVFDGETTRILSVENGELRIENYDYIYNLSGQRVSKDYKGVVVVNGKKVIRK